MIGTVTARYTTRSSKSAIEKTANTCDRRAAYCHKIVYTIYFFAWDNSPTSLVLIISNSLLFLLFVATHQMPDSKHRMIQQHPWSWKPHNLPDLFSHLRLITMYLTIRTKRLFFHEWTLLTSLFCIIRKFLTVRTHLPFLSFFFRMFFSAIQPDHLFHDILFFLPFLFYFVHLTLRFLPFQLQAFLS